jgi:hypothetical protein
MFRHRRPSRRHVLQPGSYSTGSEAGINLGSSQGKGSVEATDPGLWVPYAGTCNQAIRR